MDSTSQNPHKAAFELLKEANSRICADIIFESDLKADTPPELLLDKSNIEHSEVLRFVDPSIRNAFEEGYTGASAGGLTIHYMSDGVARSAIFLSDEPFDLKETEHSAAYWAVQTIMMHHELMHAKDLMLRKNFDLEKREVNLVKAEIYADVTTLRFFHSLQKDGGDIYRDLYAAGILGRKSTPIYKRIFNGITKSFPEAQIKAWASRSILPSAEV